MSKDQSLFFYNILKSGLYSINDLVVPFLSDFLYVYILFNNKLQAYYENLSY